MAGPERRLIQEVRHIVINKSLPPTNEWAKRKASAHTALTSKGSVNWHYLSREVEVVAGALGLIPVANFKKSIQWWKDWFTLSLEGGLFGGTESFSRIYFGGQITAAGIVYLYVPELRPIISKWLSTVACVFYTTEHHGITIMSGARSIGNSHSPEFFDWFLAVSRGKNSKKFENKPWARRNGHEALCLMPGIKESLYQGTRNPRSLGFNRTTVNGYIDRLKTIVPVRLVKTTEGCYFIWEKNFGPKPGAILVGIADERKIEYLPPKPFISPKQSYPARTVRSQNAVTLISDKWGIHTRVLPGGNVIVSSTSSSAPVIDISSYIPEQDDSFDERTKLRKFVDWLLGRS